MNDGFSRHCAYTRWGRIVKANLEKKPVAEPSPRSNSANRKRLRREDFFAAARAARRKGSPDAQKPPIRATARR